MATLNFTRSFLAFDFGTRKVGVAVGQLVTRTATALPILRYAHKAELWEQITVLIKAWLPQALIVGVPYRLDGGVSTVTELAKTFAEELKIKYGLMVYQSDEVLTSLVVRNYLKQKGRSLALLDSYAACLILEGWLNEVER